MCIQPHRRIHVPSVDEGSVEVHACLLSLGIVRYPSMLKTVVELQLLIGVDIVCVWDMPTRRPGCNLPNLVFARYGLRRVWRRRVCAETTVLRAKRFSTVENGFPRWKTVFHGGKRSRHGGLNLPEAKKPRWKTVSLFWGCLDLANVRLVFCWLGLFYGCEHMPCVVLSVSMLQHFDQ